MMEYYIPSKSRRHFTYLNLPFKINAETLSPSEDFTYLVHKITYNNSDWAAVYQNLQKYQRRRGILSRVLERTGATVQAGGEMYKAVARSVILYGSKSWVVTRDMLKVPEGFHHWAARHITGMTATRGAGEECEYTTVGEATEAAGIHPIEVYIRRRHATISERVACRPIYELCMEAERMPGTTRLVRWWDQDAVNEPED